MITTGLRLLRAFMAQHGFHLQQVANAVSVKHPSASLWLSGQTRPRTQYRHALETWTQGAVPAAAWLTPRERRVLVLVRPFTDKLAS